MGEKILDIFSKLATGKKSRIFWAIIIICLIVFVLIFPYIDANFLYYDRIEKRLDNLQKLQVIGGYSIDDVPELNEEYQSIIQEISNARERTITGNTGQTNAQSSDYQIKFVGGSIMFAIVGIIGLFSKKKNVKLTFSLFIKNNLTIFIFCFIIAAALGYVFAMIPTLGSVWTNAILSPIIQLIILFLFLQPKKQVDT